MKTRDLILKGLIIGMCIFFIDQFNVAKAQVDTTKVVQPDTVKAVITDTASQEKGKVDRKRRDEFIVYGGLNINNTNFSQSNVESTADLGYHFGGAYKRGKFFYWQAGARYNNATYGFKISDGATDTTFSMSVRSIDIPLTAGINFLSVTNRLLALRVFISAVPAFNLGVGDNDHGWEKDDINSFILYGQGGIGFNVAFFLVEVGFNYGFSDLLDSEEDINSNPSQVFINLGFRF